MEWNCKNRGRCYISKKRLIIVFIYKLIIIQSIVLLFSFFNLFFIDKRLNYIFTDYLDVEVKRICNNIVANAVNNYISKEKYGNFLILNPTSDTGVNNLSYDTERINQFSSNFSKYLDGVLSNIDKSNLDDNYYNSRFGRYSFLSIKNGLLCNISLGSINKSTLFSSLGPKVPIRMVFSGNINSDIDIQVEEYGINNAIVKIYIVVSIREQAILPLTSKENEIVIREPIVVDIIKGEIPKYYGFVN